MSAPHFSFHQLETLWIKAGGPESAAHKMAAIAMAESGGGKHPFGDCYNSVTGCTSFGPWQIHTKNAVLEPVNTLPHGVPFNENRLVHDASYTAQAAVLVYRHQGFGAWSTYLNGSYLRFMPKAAVLVAQSCPVIHASVTHHAHNMHASQAQPHDAFGSFFHALLMTGVFILARKFR